MRGISNKMNMELATIIKIVPISHNPALNIRSYYICCSIAPVFYFILPLCSFSFILQACFYLLVECINCAVDKLSQHDDISSLHQPLFPHSLFLRHNSSISLSQSLAVLCIAYYHTTSSAVCIKGLVKKFCH